MRLRSLSVKNFRNLVDVSFPIADTTVLVGENNTGKTALLDALNAALPRTGFGRTSPFDEYDYHMSSPDATPQTSDGISIELWFHEDAPGEWPDPIIQALTEIVQTDPHLDIDHIRLRVTSRFDKATDAITLIREFLTLTGEALPAKAQSASVHNRFLEYLRFFYLSALRDSDAEFSSKSQFWGRILRDLKISEEDRTRIAEDLQRLNESLLKADPRLDQVRESLETIQRVVATGATTSIQPLPIKPWDLLVKSEVVVQSAGNSVDFPLTRHGQGLQSLSVLFLFQAYIDVLLKPTFHKETDAILALEEPEAHLHPHATRALTSLLSQISAQKIVSTHSPYVIQGVPIKDLRLFRRTGASVSVRFIERSFAASIPSTEKIAAFCTSSNNKFHYSETFKQLSVNGTMTEKEYRALLTIYAHDKNVHPVLRDLGARSAMYLSDGELDDLDTYAKRIRGEVFFARAWLLCEGQSEFMLLSYFAELVGLPLDQHGITVIDFQNNGSPGAFVKLASNLSIPWVMLCDDDDAGKKYVKVIADMGFPPADLATLVRPIPIANADLERFLTTGGFLPELNSVLADRNVVLQRKLGDPGHEDEVADVLRRGKTEYTLALIRKLRDGGANQSRIPQYFAKAITDIVAKAK